MEPRRRPALDVVRGLAILLVLLFHFRAPFGTPALDATVQPIFAMGWIGVDLFFVLSGYLVGRMILAEAAASMRLDRRRFFVRRAWRLWPVLWLYCATILALGGTGAWAMVWPVLLHVQNYIDTAPSHLWSLAVEEHFYLGTALAVPPLMRRGGHRRVQHVLVAIMAGCLALRLIGLATGVPMTHLQWQTQYRLDAPAFGVLMASLSLRHPARFEAWTRRRGTWLTLAVAAAVVVASGGEGAFRHGCGYTITYLAAGAFVMAMIGTRADTLPSPLAGQLAMLGIVAYPVYVWHAGIGSVVRAAYPQAWLAMPIAVVASIAVGAGLHVLVERPAMRWRDEAGRPSKPLNAIANRLRRYSASLPFKRLPLASEGPMRRDQSALPYGDGLDGSQEDRADRRR